jgi:hypothetical protein
LKKPHKIRDPIKEKIEKFKAVNFNNFSSLAGINNNVKIPKIGNNKI